MIQLAGAADKHAAVGTSGEDAYQAFSPESVLRVDGEDLNTSIEVNVTAAQANGDYFFHLSDPAGTTFNFYQRLFARSSDSGFHLGLLPASGTGFSTIYGTAVLNLGQTYDVDIDWNFIPGDQNDSFEVFVDDASYLTHVWNSTSVQKPTTISAANLRQGNSSNGATVEVDSIVIQADTLVPEPASLSLLALGGLALARRRRN